MNDDHDFKVDDATSDLEVTVYDRHCKRADPGNPKRCALVLAAKDQHKNLVIFEVYRSVAYGVFDGEQIKWRWKTPADAYKFIKDFDVIYRKGRKKLAEAVTFTFKVFPPRSRLAFLRSPEGNRMRRASDARNRNKKKRRKYRIADPLTLAGVRSRFGHYSRS
jgi:hypothetical protein